MAHADRRLAAILSADVAGYSRLMGDDEQGTIAALAECFAVFRRHLDREHAEAEVEISDDCSRPRPRSKWLPVCGRRVPCRPPLGHAERCV